MAKEYKISEHVYELCPECGNEVRLKADLSVQKCPKCGKYIVACSMCMNDELGRPCTYDCCLTVLANHLNED